MKDLLAPKFSAYLADHTRPPARDLDPKATAIARELFDPRVDNVLLPVRDGIMVARKK